MAGLSEPPPLLPEDPSEPHHAQEAVRDSTVPPAGDEQAELQREAQARALHARAHEQPVAQTALQLHKGRVLGLRGGLLQGGLPHDRRHRKHPLLWPLLLLFLLLRSKTLPNPKRTKRRALLF
jgi:hypothetical protein